MIRLLFLIRSLGVGGAERQLVELVKGLDKSRFDITVATFYSGGAFRDELAHLPGVRVLSLRKRGRWDVFPFIWRFRRVARRFRPHIMYSTMGVSNEVSLLVGRAVGAKVVWNLRASNVDFSHYSRLSRWSFRLGAWLSSFPDLIIANSYAGKQHHIAHGYSGKRMIVINNGIETDTFRPDPQAGMGVRREWGIDEGELLVGLVGRLDPMKDHPTFLRAAALLARQSCSVRFVCVGTGPQQYEADLRSLSSDLGLDGKVLWAGGRSDMPAVYSALDLVCSSSSYGEGLPNAIAEAMSCGVPCVVTDVGDSARLVYGVPSTEYRVPSTEWAVGSDDRPSFAGSGPIDHPSQAQDLSSVVHRPSSIQYSQLRLVVPPEDPQALAAAWAGLLALPASERSGLGMRGRERILREYSVAQLARRTEDALLGVLA
jgi:glycosyltransferase involved in cell wall biosynthesis